MSLIEDFTNLQLLKKSYEEKTQALNQLLTDKMQSMVPVGSMLDLSLHTSKRPLFLVNARLTMGNSHGIKQFVTISEMIVTANISNPMLSTWQCKASLVKVDGTISKSEPVNLKGDFCRNNFEVTTEQELEAFYQFLQG